MMHKYTHVEAFYQVARTVNHLNTAEEVPDETRIKGRVDFRGTVKLHGTNAGVICADELVAQSRSRVITPDDDNLGFARFIAGEAQVDAIRDIERHIRARFYDCVGSKPIVLYGEWIGPGIQNGVAITKLPDRQWVLFAAKVVDGERTCYIDAVDSFDDEYAGAQIHSVFDVDVHRLSVDFSDELDRAKALAEAERVTALVEEMCPYAKRFGVEGMGEGLVWTPAPGPHWGRSDLFWKSKGDKHKEVKRAKRNKPALDPEVIESVDKFVEFAVTENRLNKGLDYLREMGKPVDMKSTGDFLKWMAEDVQRECRLELQDNDLSWGQVGKHVNARALSFFKEKAQVV